MNWRRKGADERECWEMGRMMTSVLSTIVTVRVSREPEFWRTRTCKRWFLGRLDRKLSAGTLLRNFGEGKVSECDTLHNLIFIFYYISPGSLNWSLTWMLSWWCLKIYRQLNIFLSLIMTKSKNSCSTGKSNWCTRTSKLSAKLRRLLIKIRNPVEDLGN